MKNENLPRKLYLSEAAAELTQICRLIDENDDPELPQELIDSFKTNVDALAAGVDRRKAVAAEFKSKIQLAKDYARQMRDFAVKLEKAFDVFKKRTLEVVEANPDVLFKDSLGRKLTAARNARPKLILAVDGLRGKKMVNNIVDEAAILLFDIDPKYLQEVRYTVLDTEKIVADLSDGKTLGWASLETAKHLRGI